MDVIHSSTAPTGMPGMLTEHEAFPGVRAPAHPSPPAVRERSAPTDPLPSPTAELMSASRTTRLLGETAPARQRVLRHPLYRLLAHPDDLRVFMEHHVFAVWDFMSLLKVLQRELTCVTVPWVPQGTPEARRLVNEIVLTEESDETSVGPRSHFELYLEAMAAAGADTGPACCFLDLLADGVAVPEAVHLCGAPPAAAAFVEHTWRIVQHAPVHCVAAAFALGREELVPRMFEHVLDGREADERTAGLDTDETDFALFREYLERHIEVDGDEHGPMALRLLENLCGFQPRRWRECAGTVTVALRARAALWDDVAEAVRSRRGAPART
ncbi:DUF3050 domain-containing protein [Yinghuangia seranimata]|uniref:DUF3050 domain-containing protein n=1 Tax=Yinghuangia seranimata TaxID=408067 RepID=UPI00248D0E46|nr:DUF3050 domain-containing protein [Yinghuangia seranimata]MDI2126471.1 DUF3050 domain-containing protein [Yinghuangia seranimata]